MSQIFISYRREGGEIMAQLLYDKLIARGYTVFYDVESLKSGRFDSKLLEEIEKAEDFLLILPPGGLDRCVSEEDWVRQEIRSAIEHKKNIVPIMLRGFSFPTNLPEDIGEIARYNGVNFGTMEFFDAKIQRILERLGNRRRTYAGSLPARDRADTPASGTLFSRGISHPGRRHLRRSLPADGSARPPRAVPVLPHALCPYAGGRGGGCLPFGRAASRSSSESPHSR